MTTYTQRQRDRFADKVNRIAAGLRGLADDVERRADVRLDLRTMEPDHSRAAEDVVHTVVWGFANLHLDGLIAIAADADRAPAVEAAEKERGAQ